MTPPGIGGGERPHVLMAHPGMQQVYQTALALQEAGYLSRFITGLYARPDDLLARGVGRLPARFRARAEHQLRRRSLAGLDPRRVTSLAALEAAKLALTSWRPLAGLRDALGPSRIIRAYTNVFDALVSLYVPAAPEDTLFAFQGCALHLLRRARAAGMITVLEQAGSLATGPILQEEYARLGMTSDELLPDTHRLLAELFLADLVVAPSAFVADALTAAGVAKERVALVPYGADLERFAPASVDERHEQFTVLYVGQMTVRKGLHYLLRAWSELSLPNARLVLIGRATDSGGARILRAFQGSYEWHDGVPHHALPAFYRASDVFVLPSLAEGSAVVTYEAMASGLPCVVTPNAGSVIRDGIDGLLVPIRDVEALKAAIVRLHANATLRRRLGLAARERASGYSWQAYRHTLAGALERAWTTRHAGAGERQPGSAAESGPPGSRSSAGSRNATPAKSQK